VHPQQRVEVDHSPAMRVSFFATLAAAAVNPSKESRMRGALLGALVADSLSLSTHYEYDAKKIKSYYGNINKYYAPGEKTGGQTHGVGWGARNFHNGNGNGPAKKAGEQTDYGDYNLLIAEHLANTASKPHMLDLQELVPFWQQKMRTWRSWMCTQTRQALQKVSQGTPVDRLGGPSNAMAVRHAAAHAYYDKEDDVARVARLSMFTHAETTALQGGEFFARVTHRVIQDGMTPKEAIEAVAAQSSSFVQSKVKLALDKAKEAMDSSSSLSKEEYVDDLAITSMGRLWDVGKSEPIKVGKASPTEGTLPGSVYFIVKYAGNFAGAAMANAEVGGDCASRAVAIGMVMGAAEGVEGIPAEFGKGKLVEWEAAQGYLDKMPLIKKAKNEL